jgi:hypothetical protein
MWWSRWMKQSAYDEREVKLAGLCARRDILQIYLTKAHLSTDRDELCDINQKIAEINKRKELEHDKKSR